MVEIDDKFYKEENFYNKDIYEGYMQDIKNYIENYKEEDYLQIIEQDKRTNIVNIFSDLRTNIIKWYPFKDNAKILEIGANYGEISKELSAKSEELTIVEFSKEKAECIQKRLEKNQNSKIILCTNLKETIIEEKYDYITLIGISEYAKKIGFRNLEDLLEWCYNHLTETGKVLLAIDNKFGVKNLAGSTKYKGEIPFAVFKRHAKKDYEIYGKDELEKILNKNINISYKFFYPVPNYNIIHAIYTDNYLPKKGDYNIYYREDEEILFNELTFMYEAIKNNKFSFFTNSYLIEIAKESSILTDVNFVNYTNIRKKEYKIITKIKEDIVTKESFDIDGIEHINKIQKNIETIKQIGFTTCEDFKNGIVESNYIKKPTFDEYLLDLINQDKIDEFYEQLYKWEKYLKSKLDVSNSSLETIFDKYNIQIEKEKEDRLSFVKDGFIDLMFQNIFYDGQGDYIVFDQEWYEENIPIEYIMYRSIKQLFFKNKYIENKIDKEDLYKKYGIYQYIEIFDEIEEKWQETITDKIIMDFYKEKWSRIISIEDIKHKYNQELERLYSENKELKKQCDILSNENIELKNKIQTIENSKSYKITKFLRRKNKDE